MKFIIYEEMFNSCFGSFYINLKLLIFSYLLLFKMIIYKWKYTLYTSFSPMQFDFYALCMLAINVILPSHRT